MALCWMKNEDSNGTDRVGSQNGPVELAERTPLDGQTDPEPTWNMSYSPNGPGKRLERTG